MPSTGPEPPPPSFNLDRFVEAQSECYPRALEELRRGRKESHWMWFIFPQVLGLGHSATSRHFAIRSLGEARAFLHHPVLGPRLLECCRALLLHTGRTAHEIMGSPDDLKLRSSMTLFSLVPESEPEFRDVLRRFFDGRMDERTPDLLGLSTRV